MFNWLTKLFKTEKPELKKEKSISVKDINNVKIKVAYIPKTKKFVPSLINPK